MEPNPGIEALRKLASTGYRFKLAEETIKAGYEGPGDPDPSQVRPLLALVKEHKAEMIDYPARKPQDREHIITCFECDYFRPTVNFPNPTQAWGRCEKRQKERYGCGTACPAALTDNVVGY